MDDGQREQKEERKRMSMSGTSGNRRPSSQSQWLGDDGDFPD